MSPWNRLDSVNQNCRLAEFSLFFFLIHGKVLMWSQYIVT